MSYIIKVAHTQESRLRVHGPNGDRNAQTAETRRVGCWEMAYNYAIRLFHIKHVSIVVNMNFKVKACITITQFLGIVLHCVNGLDCLSGESYFVTGCTCRAGYHVIKTYMPWPNEAMQIDGRCFKCHAGTYAAAGALACTNCAASTYSYAGAASCTAGVPSDASLNITNEYYTDIDGQIHAAVTRAIGVFSTVNEVDAAVIRAIASLDVDQFLVSRAPGLYVCVVVGLVVALLNSVAILVLFLWVRRLKRAATQTHDLKSVMTAKIVPTEKDAGFV